MNTSEGKIIAAAAVCILLFSGCTRRTVVDLIPQHSAESSFPVLMELETNAAQETFPDCSAESSETEKASEESGSGFADKNTAPAEKLQSGTDFCTETCGNETVDRHETAPEESETVPVAEKPHKEQNTDPLSEPAEETQEPETVPENTEMPSVPESVKFQKEDLAEQLNQLRAERGLPPVALDPVLCDLAFDRACGYFSEDRPDLREYLDRSSYPAEECTEAFLSCSSEAEAGDVMYLWSDTEAFYSDSFHTAGIGICRGTDVSYVCIIFVKN